MERLQIDLLTMRYFMKVLAAYPAQKDNKGQARQPEMRRAQSAKRRLLLMVVGLTCALLGGWWLA